MQTLGCAYPMLTHETWPSKLSDAHNVCANLHRKNSVKDTCSYPFKVEKWKTRLGKRLYR